MPPGGTESRAESSRVVEERAGTYLQVRQPVRTFGWPFLVIVARCPTRTGTWRGEKKKVQNGPVSTAASPQVPLPLPSSPRPRSPLIEYSQQPRGAGAGCVRKEKQKRDNQKKSEVAYGEALMIMKRCVSSFGGAERTNQAQRPRRLWELAAQ